MSAPRPWRRARRATSRCSTSFAQTDSHRLPFQADVKVISGAILRMRACRISSWQSPYRAQYISDLRSPHQARSQLRRCARKARPERVFEQAGVHRKADLAQARPLALYIICARRLDAKRDRLGLARRRVPVWQCVEDLRKGQCMSANAENIPPCPFPTRSEPTRWRPNDCVLHLHVLGVRRLDHLPA